MCNYTYHCGGLIIELKNGSYIWCGPNWIKWKTDRIPELPQFSLPPYWVAGPKCKSGQAGPDLTDEEVNDY